MCFILKHLWEPACLRVWIRVTTYSVTTFWSELHCLLLELNKTGDNKAWVVLLKLSVKMVQLNEDPSLFSLIQKKKMRLVEECSKSNEEIQRKLVAEKEECGFWFSLHFCYQAFCLGLRWTKANSNWLWEGVQKTVAAGERLGILGKTLILRDPKRQDLQ